MFYSFHAHEKHRAPTVGWDSMGKQYNLLLPCKYPAGGKKISYFPSPDSQNDSSFRKGHGNEVIGGKLYNHTREARGPIS